MSCFFSLQDEKEKDAKKMWKKKNGLIQRERPAGRESPQQVDSHIHHMNNRHDSTTHILLSHVCRWHPSVRHLPAHSQAVINNVFMDIQHEQMLVDDCNKFNVSSVSEEEKCCRFILTGLVKCFIILCVMWKYGTMTTRFSGLLGIVNIQKSWNDQSMY